ncbi:hypothetical protein HDU81_007578 [Chytriomyces hyalinus]|nr:hypothetical protein HDU81_007578 [Chytriomyces hyalinus]
MHLQNFIALIILATSVAAGRRKNNGGATNNGGGASQGGQTTAGTQTAGTQTGGTAGTANQGTTAGTASQGTAAGTPGSTQGVTNLNSDPYLVLNAPAAAQNSTDAFSNFANHVYGVSTALIGLSYATNPNSVIAMANAGFAHEAVESIEAMAMARNTNNNGGAPLQALVANTPCVLNGLTLAALNPSQAATLATQMTIVRDALILPNILALGQLSNAQNLLQFPSVGPLLSTPVNVQQPGSQILLAAQTALNCAPGQTQTLSQLPVTSQSTIQTQAGINPQAPKGQTGTGQTGTGQTGTGQTGSGQTGTGQTGQTGQTNGSTQGVTNLNTSPYSVLNAPAAAQNSTDAFSNFANHVYAVSTSLIGLSYATNANSVTAMANSGFAHEALESIEAMVMARNTNNNGGAPLQALVANTPCVLNGLKMAVQNPTTAAQVATQMSIVRDAMILPNILALGQLSNAQNLLQFPSTGPLLSTPVQVQQPGSATLLAAQTALGCAPGQNGQAPAAGQQQATTAQQQGN